MENIGVSVGIVIDDHAEFIDNMLMSDDGTGGGIRIPSMLIKNLKLYGVIFVLNKSTINVLTFS
jgi:hypothetical protein